MPDKNIADLIDRLLDGSITAAEKELLAQWMLHDNDDDQLHATLEQAWSDFNPGQTLPAEKADELFGSILHKIKEQPPVHDIGWWKGLRRAYRIAAAVLLFVIGTATIFYFLRTPTVPTRIAGARGDVAPPAITKAVLTLSDGRKIALDSVEKGNIATQRTTAIVKRDDGDIAYRIARKGEAESAEKDDDLEYNTLTVPRGSRIAHITLSDGTTVWLNAGSSLRYPVAFNGTGRKVEVTGECYFEVAQDKAHPFVVTKGNNSIAVLGTHFNVNAYDEEGAMKVTLLEGAVRVASATGNRLLLPGQMAIMDAGQPIDVLKKADVRQVMAWKNGYFNFSNADIRTVMRELARWYGLELTFNNVTNERFHVEMSRDIPLSKVLRILEMTDKIHFNIAGNKVTVMP